MYAIPWIRDIKLKKLTTWHPQQLYKYLLENGRLHTVSSMPGHFDAGFTLRTYTHAARQKQDEAQTMGFHGPGDVISTEQNTRQGTAVSCLVFCIFLMITGKIFFAPFFLHQQIS